MSAALCPAGLWGRDHRPPRIRGFSRGPGRQPGQGQRTERGLPTGPVGGGFDVPPGTPGPLEPSLRERHCPWPGSSFPRLGRWNPLLLGGAESIPRQRWPCPGQRQAGARVPPALQPLSGLRAASEITQETVGTSRSLSASEGTRRSRRFPGAACHAPQGPLGPAAEGCAAGAIPVLLGADPELCSGPGLFPFLARGWKEWSIAKPNLTSPVSRSPAAPE